MKTIAELRQLSASDLQAELLALRRDQLNLRMKQANKTLDKTHTVSLVRKTIARVKTLITEKAGNGNDK